MAAAGCDQFIEYLVKGIRGALLQRLPRHLQNRVTVFDDAPQFLAADQTRY